MVGDDETITSNSLLYNILCVLIGTFAARIKISWSDVGFSKDFYNYAEGWIFLPPSARSSFEAVTKYARGSGVPFVLDPVKMKNLSPVRKQSEMDRDLPSKFRNLAETAAWTHPAWPTFHLHQFALLLGVEAFDFMRSKLFPYLFHPEGGCGGPPPWGNLHTAAASIYRYRRGTAKRGILGIMAESNDLFSGRLKPSDSFFVKNLSLATSGDKRWKDIRGYLEAVREECIEFDEDYFTDINQNAEEYVPAELLAKSAVIYPEDIMTGVAASFLRDKGYIMTELDVVMKTEEAKKLKAVWGEVPLSEVEDQVELRKREYKEAFLETLYVIDTMREPSRRVESKLDYVREPFEQQSLAIMSRYYRMRIEQSSYITSFIYNDRLRLFKSGDVEAYFDKGCSGIRNQFSSSLGSQYRPEHRRTIQLPEEKATFDRIEAWLDSGDLKDLLLNPIPPGVGPDDSRIMRNILLDLATCIKDDSWDGLIILVISSDKKLINAIARIIQHNHPQLHCRVIGLAAHDYFRWCLSEDDSIKGPRIKWIAEESIYNCVTQQQCALRGPLYKLLAEQATFLFRARKKALLAYYDYPNINRLTARYKLGDGVVQEVTGGFLSKNYLEARRDFSTIGLSEVKNIPDFRMNILKVITPLSNLRQTRMSIYSTRDQTSAIGESSTHYRKSKLSQEIDEIPW
jgi:hypothetical protein